MKSKNIWVLPFLLLSFLLAGCESKKSQLKSQSPDGQVEIIVNGTKSAMEPWNLVIEIKAKDKTNTMETELYTDELNENNVIFNWTDNNTCVIKLTHQDGESRMLEITI